MQLVQMSVIHRKGFITLLEVSIISFAMLKRRSRVASHCAILGSSPGEILLPVISTRAKCAGKVPVTFTCVKHTGDPVASTRMERTNGYLHQCEASRFPGAPLPR